MLRRLHIENLVLIREADLEFAAGLNAVTGETGAGKTIFTQAIGLLLGNKADASLIGPYGKETFIQAEFDLPAGILEDEELSQVAEMRPEGEEGLVIARRIFSDGRSRAYVWSRAVSVADLSTLTERLVAMSGQFEQRRLAKPSHQLDLIDAFCGDAQLQRRDRARQAWKTYQAAKRRHDEIARDEEAARIRIEEMQELVEATKDFKPGEEAELRAEEIRLGRLHDLVQATAGAAATLAPEDDEDGAADLAGKAVSQLEPVAMVDEKLSALQADMRAAEDMLRDSAAELRSYLTTLEAEPGRLEEIEARLTEMTDVRRRFRAVDYDDLLARAGAARQELATRAGGSPLEAAAAELETARHSYRLLAQELRAERKKAATKFAKAAKKELSQLAMGDGDVKVEVNDKQAGPSGADEVTLMIRPNPGLPFAPASATASGGELSRVALALRIVAHSNAGEGTIVFDEIDAGVGGETAHAVAAALQRLAKSTQIITITHLPQIASVADQHLRVEKLRGKPTETTIQLLDDAAKQAEITRMLGGSDFLAGVSK